MLIDQTGARIDSFSLDMNAGEEISLGSYFVEPQIGAVLRAQVVDELTFYAKRTGTADPYESLTTGIDLSALAPGVPVEFDLKAEASLALTGIYRETIWVGVEYGVSTMGWY